MLRLISVLLLCVLLAGCQFGDVSIQPQGDGTAAVTLTLTEAEVNALVQAALAATPNALLRDPVVDVQPGQMVISGSHLRRAGGGGGGGTSIAGSLTVTLTVADGRPVAQITAASIEGIALSDPRIAALNERLTQALGARFARDHANARLTAITLAGDALTVVLTVRPNP
ncbi:MAG: hypothetical protein MUE40_08185 [Anaerolineae bacterium]|nr:hypothetical protein [Anaerolineae bacterium]